MKSTIVLVHGGMHGGWCWDHVAPLLESVGHRVIAPDLPGASGAALSLADVTLTRYGDALAAMIEQEDDPVLLVGHSMGGIAISAAAERVPDRLVGLAYVTALLVPNNCSASDYAGDALEAAYRGSILSEDGAATRYDPTLARDVFYNETALDLALGAISRLTPQAVAPMMQPIALSEDRFGRVRRAYVECTLDHVLPLAFQRDMQRALPCDPIFSLVADHSPFFSAPAKLAAHLLEVERLFAIAR